MRTGVVLVALAVALGALSAGAVPSVAQSSGAGHRIFRPAGAGPHPGVVFVSGCSGFAPSFAPGVYDRVAEDLRGRGYVVVYADYLARWNLKSCVGAPITHADGAKELLAAAAWLRAQPGVDPARITALGWSFGGGAVLVALGRYPEAELGFSRAIVYYPSCRSLPPWPLRVPLLMLIGGDDDVAPGKPCQQAADKSAAPGVIRTVVYPGALHGFDVKELPARMKGPTGTIGYHPQAAAAAWEEIVGFLAAGK